MLIGIAYLAMFLAAGLLLARWAVPDGSPAVAVPLGCGFGVSLLAALPAGFALVCGFTLRAVWGRPALRGIDFCRARTYPFC